MSVLIRKSVDDDSTQSFQLELAVMAGSSKVLFVQIPLTQSIPLFLIIQPPKPLEIMMAALAGTYAGITDPISG